MADRILQEIHATGGDIRRICDLFGLSIEAALRYAATEGHPDLADGHASSRKLQTRCRLLTAYYPRKFPLVDPSESLNSR